MKWLKRTFRRRRAKRTSKLDRQVRLGLLQDAMGRAEQRQDDARQARDADKRNARSCPAGVSTARRLGTAEG